MLLPGEIERKAQVMPTHRRQFLGQASLFAAATLAAQAAPKPKERLRVGFVGIGVKGSAHLGNLLRMPQVDVVAVCDVREIQCREAQAQAKRLGKKEPTAYTKGDLDFQRMCAEEDLDLVYTATPWDWHVRVCLAAMQNGKHVATEIPAAYSMEDCWALVELSDKTGLHCTMMENANYFRNELTIFHMVRKGLLGELIHAEGGYLHDTRQLKMNDHGDGLWLGNHHAYRNGNLYPTHGLGPIAWYMNLNRGDRMEYMVSMSSKARGLDLYAAKTLPEGHPKRTRSYKNGDVNTCLIRTVNGCSIVIKHDTDSPRPYSRTNHVQGTKGLAVGYPDFIVSLEEEGNPHPKWRSGEEFRAEHEHPLWKHASEVHAAQPGIAEGEYGPLVEGAVWDYKPATELRNGDFLEDYRLIQAHLAGIAPDFDVYDAASWSAVAILSEQSVANRSQAIDFPDFTKGKWKTLPPVQMMGV
jgi:predicted dehydrogenase